MKYDPISNIKKLRRDILGQPKQIKVSEAYSQIRESDGPKVAMIFHQLMREWDGSATVLQAFYDRDVIEMKHQEAREIVE